MNLSSHHENGTLLATGNRSTAGRVIYSLCIAKTVYVAINVLMGLIGLVGVTLNVAVLVTFFKRRSLINPFTVHIVSMSVISVLRSVLFHPLVTARPYVEGDYLQYSFVACAVFQYIAWILPTMSLLQDLVICADRWLALLAPYWHAHENSVRKGLLATAAVTLWAHAWWVIVTL